MTAEIISFGEPLFEFNQVKEYSGEGPDYLSGFGGDASNFACCAARQGASVAILTHLGNDVFGNKFIDLWEKEGVQTHLIERNAIAPTGIYFISHDEQGHHFSFARKGSAASQITPEQLPADAIRAAKLFHVTAITQAISTSSCDSVFKGIEIAKEGGTLTSFDTNLRLKLWDLNRARGIIHETARLVDFIMPSVDEAEVLTGLSDPDKICDFYLNLGSKNVILKLGKEGAMYATASERKRVAGNPVEAIDATGAGDCFSGSFFTNVVAGKSLEDSLKYANAAAALTTQGYGAVAPIPTRDQVETFMKARDI
ncbi:2-keto-3-deoxygluconate kinase [Pseudovibrio denitrificans]|uniref:2-keto-3-deoxygluconate kinase n=1 Tax=Pseudovibrio denitrificans TaxID=258256 RepID=A0A1I7DWZ5_9HYPH|nr:sugar kinase [Pseudovibrio denitrificans]SFU16198.1 2-keto-3-deoxygluconate kinase [Pseudovibrio denitrificans]